MRIVVCSTKNGCLSTAPDGSVPPILSHFIFSRDDALSDLESLHGFFGERAEISRLVSGRASTGRSDRIPVTIQEGLKGFDIRA